MKLDAAMGCVVGHRFSPRDHELIQYYLIPKVSSSSSSDFNSPFITEANVYGLEPEDLASQANYDPADGKFYFFADRSLKNSKGAKRANRTLTLDGERRGGRWKDRGKPNPIFLNQGNLQIGTRRTLSYIRNGETRPTDWRMHEYTLEVKGGRNKNGPSSSSLLGKRKGTGYLDTVICRMFLKDDQEDEENELPQTDSKKKKRDQSYSSYSNVGEPSCSYQQCNPPPQDQCHQYNVGESSSLYQHSQPEDQHHQYKSQEEDQTQVLMNDLACSQQQNQMEAQPISHVQQQQDQSTLESALTFTEMMLLGSDDFPDIAEDGSNGMNNEVLDSYTQWLVQ